MNPIDIVLHIDRYLNDLVSMMGLGFYGFLFAIVFCETGLVVTPFLPGDSLLFAVGALAAIDQSPLNIGILAIVFFTAALCGDVTNYSIGRHLGPKVFSQETSRLLNRRHLEETRKFYVRHGGKTIVMARFLPILRTFAPFVAGIGHMEFRRFASFSVLGAGLWIIPFLGGGYFLGNVPAVKSRFHIVIIAIVLISATPAVIQFIRARMHKPGPDAARQES